MHAIPAQDKGLKMGESPFIKFYPSDFLAGTSGLSSAERGAYITILCLIYEADGPIARDDARLSRRCGVPKASFRKMIDALVAEDKLQQSDGMISNKRAEKAIVDRTNRKQNSTHAARARWTAQGEKSEENQRADDAGALPEQSAGICQPEPEPEPELKIEPIGSTKKPRRKPDIDLPDDWVPNERNIRDAHSKQFSDEEIRHEADRFRDHHISKQSRFRDWDAAWRTWLSNARKFGTRGPVAGGPSTGGYGQGGSIASIVARRRAEGKV